MRNIKKPFVPPITCPHIDNVQSLLKELHELFDEIGDKDLEKYVQSLVDLINSELEHIRLSNDLLRSSGKFWYDRYNKK